MIQFANVEITGEQGVLIVSMATHLIRNRVTTTEREAIRSLSTRYAIADVAAFAGDALALAQRALKGAA